MGQRRAAGSACQALSGREQIIKLNYDGVLQSVLRERTGPVLAGHGHRPAPRRLRDPLQAPSTRDAGPQWHSWRQGGGGRHLGSGLLFGVPRLLRMGMCGQGNGWQRVCPECPPWQSSGSDVLGMERSQRVPSASQQPCGFCPCLLGLSTDACPQETGLRVGAAVTHSVAVGLWRGCWVSHGKVGWPAADSGPFYHLRWLCLLAALPTGTAG